MTDDPSSPLYYNFNFYSIPTDFEYVGIRTLVGTGWSIDNKAYTNAASPGDILTLMSGRSVSVSLTVGFSPR